MLHGIIGSQGVSIGCQRFPDFVNQQTLRFKNIFIETETLTVDLSDHRRQIVPRFFRAPANGHGIAFGKVIRPDNARSKNRIAERFFIIKRTFGTEGHRRSDRRFHPAEFLFRKLPFRTVPEPEIRSVLNGHTVNITVIRFVNAFFQRR